MKKNIKQLLWIQLIMFLTLLVLLATKHYVSVLTQILFLGITLTVTILLFGMELKSSIKRKETLVDIMIGILIYFLFIYLSGLFIGFNKSGYSYSLSNIKYNILPATLIIILSEFIRYQFINKSNKNMRVVIISCLIFILFENYININLYNFKVTDETFLYIGMILITSISKNIFLTILCYKSDYLNPIIYRLMMELYVFLVPIIPAFGEYINCILSISFPILLSFTLLFSSKKKIKEKPKNKKKDILTFIIMILLLMLILINSGYLKYRTFTIGSNSMLPYMARGDAVLVEKYKEKELYKIKKGDILLFYYDNKIISHRVIKITKKANEYYYKTKGDSNDQPDAGIVDKTRIIGVEKLRIKYIGMPSVWLQERFK